MKTSAISNPVNFTSGATSTAKPSGADPDQPFSQMLSREMAARPTAGEPAKSNTTQDSKAPQAARSESKSDDTKTSDESDTDTAPETTASSVTTAKSGTGEAAKTKDDNSDQDGDATVSTASADLLALVASLTQAVSRASSADADTTDKGEPAKLDAAADEGKSKGKPHDLSAADLSTADLSVAASSTTPTPVPNAIATAQATSPLESLPIGARSADQLLSAPGMAQGVDKAGKALAGPTSGIPRRAAGIGLDGRTGTAPTNKEIAPEPGEFGAKLAQAKDEKPASDAAGSKAASTPAELAVTLSAERPSAKTIQDVQQPAAVPFNINTLSAAQPQAQPVQQMAAQAADMLSPRVGSPGWDQALGQKVVWMVGGEQQSASLTLNPPDLGPLQVVLHVSDNQATANFTAAQPEVRHALEQALPKLREMLGDAGIQLSQANVSAGTPNHQQGAFGQPQQSSRQAAATEDDGDAPAVRVVRSQTISGGQGLVDTFV